MKKAKNTLKTSSKQQPVSLIKRAWAYIWPSKWWRRIVSILLAILILFTGGMYGIAQWYIHKHANEPMNYGVTFVPGYAEYFGLDAKETMQAIIDDLHVKRFRLVSYWEDIEPTQDNYDFSKLDWQFEKANAAGAKVSLAIGLRQPRWPECHIPTWADNQPRDFWYPQLKEVMKRVIERYKDNPALDSYQLENEFFLTVFGLCKDFDRDRLIDEYNFVKSLDPNRKLIISRSNNALGTPINEPTPDEYAVSVYKRVWDKTITKRYYEYPFPSWFYSFLGGTSEIVKGKNMIIHELQAESWLPEGYDMKTAPLSEQNKSLNAERLKGRFDFARETGIKTVDLWGVEWWYWRKVTLNDPSLWDVAQQEFDAANSR